MIFWSGFLGYAWAERDYTRVILRQIKKTNDIQAKLNKYVQITEEQILAAYEHDYYKIPYTLRSLCSHETIKGHATFYQP